MNNREIVLTTALKLLVIEFIPYNYTRLLAHSQGAEGQGEGCQQEGQGGGRGLEAPVVRRCDQREPEAATARHGRCGPQDYSLRVLQVGKVQEGYVTKQANVWVWGRGWLRTLYRACVCVCVFPVLLLTIPVCGSVSFTPHTGKKCRYAHTSEQVRKVAKMNVYEDPRYVGICMLVI